MFSVDSHGSHPNMYTLSPAEVSTALSYGRCWISVLEDGRSSLPEEIPPTAESSCRRRQSTCFIREKKSVGCMRQA